MTEKPAAGDIAPAFELSDQDGKTVKLSDFKGQWVVLFFYPKDNTSGWTLEAKAFSAQLSEFNKLDAVVLGVSPDSKASHVRFIEQQDLKVRLLSDPGHAAMAAYGVWQLKKMYGREFMGVVRSTFIIDRKGKVAEVWRKVKVKGHVDEVLERLKKVRG